MGISLVPALRSAAMAATVMTLPYAAYVVATWCRHGRADARHIDHLNNALDQFMPDYEVAERHEIEVNASVSETLVAARNLDLQDSPIVRAIFSIRTFPERLRGEPEVSFKRGILDETLAMGWGMLSEETDSLVILGAVTQPWEASPTFRSLPPEGFAGFDEPGFAKIIWTLSATKRDGGGSLFQTETRVKTTDTESRARFRRYWAFLSPGILLIRQEALRLVKGSAERRAEARAEQPENRGMLS